MTKLNDFENWYAKAGKSEVEMPPAYMWQKIEASLDAKSKNNKFIIWYKIVPIAASITLLLYLSLFHNIDNKHLDITNKPIVKLTETDENSNNKKDFINIEENKTSNYINNNTNIKEENKTEEIFTNNLFLKTDIKQETTNNDKKITPLIAHIPTIKKSDILVDKLPIEQPKNDKWIEKYSVINDFPIYNSSENKKSQREISIGGSLSPMYSYRQTTNSSNFSNALPNQEKGVVNLALAVDVNMKLSKNLSIESGVRYSKMGQNVNTEFYHESMFFMAGGRDGNAHPQETKVSVANSMGHFDGKVKSASSDKMINTLNFDRTMELAGFEVSDNDISGKLEQQLEYIEIPVTLRYTIPLDLPVTLSLAGGISSNWLIDNNTYLTLGEETHAMGETKNLSSNNWSSHAGIGLNFPIYRQLSLKIEPRVNYFLTDINKDHPVGYRPYSFGFFSGIQYSFGN